MAEFVASSCSILSSTIIGFKKSYGYNKFPDVLASYSNHFLLRSSHAVFTFFGGSAPATALPCYNKATAYSSKEYIGEKIIEGAALHHKDIGVELYSSLQGPTALLTRFFGRPAIVTTIASNILS